MKKKKVVWIDKNNNKSENRSYLDIFSEELKDFSFSLVTSVTEGYSLLEKFDFELIYVILSGKLAEEFLDVYEENLRNMTSLTLNIIFCFDGAYHKSKKYANDPFYNPGGVVTNFKDVIKFLTMDIYNKNINKKKIKKEKNDIGNDKNSNGKSFIFISKTLENLSLPIIFKKYSSRFINEDSFENFKLFLLENYYDGLDILKINTSYIKIPFYLFSKIFLKLYTLESDFYKDLNKSLRNSNFSDFNQFIFLLYYGLNRKVIEDGHNFKLYRFSNITKKEYDSILNSSCRLVLANTFLSFSKSKRIAEYFKPKNDNPNLKKILFVVNPILEENTTVTNIDVENISYFKDEREVVFLPFSGLEIVGINEGTEYSTIYLNYLNKYYEKKVTDYIDAKSKDKVEDFLKNLVKESKKTIFKDIITEKSIKFIEDYRNKKNILWIDQYCRCKTYDKYMTKYSEELKNFYIEKATTIDEAYSILSNYEFKMIYIIINDKLSSEFFYRYNVEIKKLGVITANIIFCDEEPKIKNIYFNDPFINPGKIVTDFSKVVYYLNADENGFNNILKMNKSIDSSFAGKDYVFKEINESQIINPNIMIQTIINNLPSKESINQFKNFIYKYGNKLLSKVVNPSQEKIIDLPLFMYPKFYMRMYGLQTNFYYDINKYLTNQENDFGIYNTFITILYYGLSENILINNDEFPFFRGGVISKKEYKLIEDNYKLNKNLYFCKNFLSFSRSEEEANKFIERNFGCNDSLHLIKFIIEKCEKKDLNEKYLMSNIEMRHYSGYATEQEVLFLPLSSFKVNDIYDFKYKNNEIKIIKLNYVGMYKNK